MTATLNVVDFFCGAGGFSKGLEQAGLKMLAGIDYNQSAIATFNKNHQCKGYVKDVTQLSTRELKELLPEQRVDVIVGGFPCQGFSLLGRRKKNDPRNVLYKELLRFIRELKPRYFILENVRGLLSMKYSNGERVLPIILKDLMTLGYVVSYKLLRASDYGVPQDRERVIIFGQKCCFFDIPTIEVKKTVFDAINDLPNAEEGINAHIFTKHDPEYSKRLGIVKQGESLGKFRSTRFRLRAFKPSVTITSGEYIHPVYDRFLTPRECARLQSFSDDFIFCGNKGSMKLQIGNAVPPLLGKALGERLLKLSRGER